MTSGLGRLWAGWRSEYVESGGDEGSGEDGCTLCRILGADESSDEQTYVLRRSPRCAAVLNAYPYTSGHLMVMPLRHVAELEELTHEEVAELWGLLADAVRALKAVYSPDGLNVGANLGRSAGAGVPGHFHVHCLPRWAGDTNFMTTVAETRVIPEALPSTHERLSAAWPQGQPGRPGR